MRVTAAPDRAASEDEIEQDDYEEGDAEKPKKNASHDDTFQGMLTGSRKGTPTLRLCSSFYAETNQP